MLNEYSLVIGSIAAVIGIIGYIPYYINIFKNKTKPHAFTWFVWGLMTGIIFIIQVLKGAGPGSYVTGTATLLSFIIAIIAFIKNEIIYDKYDWLSLTGAILGIMLWWLTKNPFFAVLLIIISDALGFYPTLRKGLKKPFEETASTFIINSLKYVVAMFAMKDYSLTTILYPIYLIIMNGSFSLILFFKRKKQ